MRKNPAVGIKPLLQILSSHSSCTVREVADLYLRARPPWIDRARFPGVVKVYSAYQAALRLHPVLLSGHCLWIDRALKAAAVSKPPLVTIEVLPVNKGKRNLKHYSITPAGSQLLAKH
jgi:hypothetical protein